MYNYLKAKKLPPSSENVIDSIKKSITTLIDETREAADSAVQSQFESFGVIK